MTGERQADDRAAGLAEGPSLLRSEEELSVATSSHEAGTVRARKVVENHHAQEVVPRDVEHAEVERANALEGDSGMVETLPDGTVSIPVFEEVLVVEKRLVVRERVLIRKHTITEEHLVEADLRRERVDVDADKTVEARVSEAEPGATRDERSVGPSTA